VPARVVLGAVPEPGGVVKGKDVHAWVEVHAADGSWLRIPTSEFMPDTSKKPDKIPPQQQQNSSAAVVRRPIRCARRARSTARISSRLGLIAGPAKNSSSDSGGNQFPARLGLIGTYGGPPIAAIVLPCLLIVALKELRRRRRRSRGATTTQVAAGWREIVDYARDLGRPVPAGRPAARTPVVSVRLRWLRSRRRPIRWCSVRANRRRRLRRGTGQRSSGPAVRSTRG